VPARRNSHGDVGQQALANANNKKKFQPTPAKKSS